MLPLFVRYKIKDHLDSALTDPIIFEAKLPPGASLWCSLIPKELLTSRAVDPCLSLSRLVGPDMCYVPFCPQGPATRVALKHPDWVASKMILAAYYRDSRAPVHSAGTSRDGMAVGTRYVNLVILTQRDAWGKPLPCHWKSAGLNHAKGRR